MSKLFSKVKKFYDLGLYTKEKVAQFVIKGVITAEEYKDITSDDYE